MLNINNRIFAKNNKEFTNTLFNPVEGKTAYGYYKKVKNGVKLLDAQKKLFAFIVNNKFNEQFFVSASKLENGKTFYMYGLNDSDAEKLGIENSGFSEKRKFAIDAIKQVNI